MTPYEIDQQLGREFLTWLWCQTETGGGELELEQGGQVALMMDEELVLAAADGVGEGIDILRAGDPARSGEAAAALLAGKLAVQARLVLVRGQEEWLFTLDQRLRLRGVRLPRGEADHPQDIFAEQMRAVEDLCDVLDELYARFARARLAGGWPAELKTLRRWVAEK